MHVPSKRACIANRSLWFNAYAHVASSPLVGYIYICRAIQGSRATDLFTVSHRERIRVRSWKKKEQCNWLARDLYWSYATGSWAWLSATPNSLYDCLVVILILMAALEAPPSAVSLRPLMMMMIMILTAEALLLPAANQVAKLTIIMIMSRNTMQGNPHLQSKPIKSKDINWLYTCTASWLYIKIRIYLLMRKSLYLFIYLLHSCKSESTAPFC